MPDTLVLPPEQHALISTLRLTDSDRTVMEFLMNAFGMITSIESWYRLEGIGSAGSDRMVLYKRAPDKLAQEINQEFTQLPVQEQGLEFVVNTVAQTAGSVFYYPLSADYSDKI
jgi:hypothetical protein